MPDGMVKLCAVASKVPLKGYYGPELITANGPTDRRQLAMDFPTG